ncbi:MAG: PorT family protein [Flavobacteriales bacterium]|nr:PorT family protein [Flavobacteriales bacterium]
MRFLFIIFLFVSSGIRAQSFGGGVFGGISTSQVTGDNIGGFNKVGGWGGLYTDFRFTPRSALQLELSFIQKGSKQTPTVKNGNTLFLHNQNMVEMPILYRWYGVKNLSLEIGTQVGFFLSTVERDNFNETRNNPLFRKAEWSVAAGISYFFLKSKKLEVNARFANSILSVKRGDWWMNHVIAFSLRYWFKTTLDQDKIKASAKKDKIKIEIK